MADVFDMIDLVYNCVESANTGLTLYKDHAITGEIENHIVINNEECQSLDYTNKAPINVNIFIKNISNGMVNRNLAKDVQSKVEQSLNNYKSHKPNGQYLVLEKESSEPINNAKKGFFCINIKLIVSIEK